MIQKCYIRYSTYGINAITFSCILKVGFVCQTRLFLPWCFQLSNLMFLRIIECDCTRNSEVCDILPNVNYAWQRCFLVKCFPIFQIWFEAKYIVWWNIYGNLAWVSLHINYVCSQVYYKKFVCIVHKCVGRICMQFSF